MKFGHLKAFVGAMALSVAMAGASQAQVVVTGGSSDWSKVDIGLSTVNAAPVHYPDRVGIGVPNTGLDDQRIDFQGLKNILGNNEVTTFTATTTDVEDHSTYGRFDYVQAGSYDVYFGEWSQTGSATAGDHTVYFGGTGATPDTSIPLSGTASYNVKGISDYASTNALLTGTFNADFGAGTLSGSIENGTLRVNIGTADIVGSAIEGVGTATAYNASTNATLASGGNVDGQFFGSAAQALAGIATFAGNRQLDTAFGGTQ